MIGPIDLLPPQASAHAGKLDLLFGSFGAMVALLTLPVFVLMVIFAIRYRTTNEVNRDHAENHNLWIELSWSIIPFLLTVGFFVWATSLYFDLRTPPPDAYRINVVAKQWMWKFQHPDGTAEINELHVPANTPVRLVMTSRDVIHSLYLPAMRIKQDVLPGRYTEQWFEANGPGIYPLRCAEFCGTDHSVMGGRLIVMNPGDYAEWLEDEGSFGTSATLAQQGERLFRDLGCSGCHGAASTVKAPDLAGVFGRPVGLSDGTVVLADEQYLHDSIMLPNSQIVGGYPPIMPTYGNLIEPEQVNALVAYLKLLNPIEGRPR